MGTGERPAAASLIELEEAEPIAIEYSIRTARINLAELVAEATQIEVEPSVLDQFLQNVIPSEYGRITVLEASSESHHELASGILPVPTQQKNATNGTAASETDLVSKSSSAEAEVPAAIDG